MGPPVRVTWPHLRSDWYWNYFIQAALMTGLAGALVPRPLGKRVSPPVFVGLLFVAMLFDERFHGFRYLWWPALALLWTAFGVALVFLFVARCRNPVKTGVTWGAPKGSLSVAAWLCPMTGFLVSELLAGTGQPAASTLPLHGAMAGFAVGMFLGGLNPLNALRSVASSPPESPA